MSGRATTPATGERVWEQIGGRFVVDEVRKAGTELSMNVVFFLHISHLSCATGEAVFARCLSSLRTERVEASRILSGPEAACYDGNRKEMVDNIKLVQNTALLRHC